jgi:hypothetical protein
MHEMEGPRRVLLPCGHRSLGIRRPCRTCSSCSVSAIARLTRSGNGLLVAVRRSRSLGSSSYAELAPRGPPVPIARVQLLRRAGAPPTWSRSLGTRQRGTASPRPASIAQDSSSRGQLRRAIGDCSPVHTSELITFFGNPLRTAVSRCPPRPGSRPPGRSPFPVTRRFLVGDHPAPQELSRSIFHRVIHRYIHSHPPDRPPSGHDPPTLEADRLPAYAMDHQPVHFAQPSALAVAHPRSGPATGVRDTPHRAGPLRTSVGARSCAPPKRTGYRRTR